MKSKLASTKKLSEVNAKDYDAIFFVGGHGPVIDLPDDPVNINLISEVLCPRIYLVIRLRNFRFSSGRMEKLWLPYAMDQRTFYFSSKMEKNDWKTTLFSLGPLSMLPTHLASLFSPTEELQDSRMRRRN